ncbi:MAG: amino acid adenylation domain-containing protein [Anaerolineaceae bacterium]|nr:amino acid adenylation domain-containing protein [Anaerolineaceae bacterium]
MTDEHAALSAEQKRALLAQLLREKAAKSKTTVPMSYGQRALWFVQQLAPENTAYHIAFSARIRSAVDVPALQRALQTLTNRHAALRAVFPVQNGVPVQSVPAYQAVAFEQVDAAGLDDTALYERVLATHRLPFDFEQQPPVRWYLVTRSADDHVLLMTVHHIIFDNWSNWIVMEELRQLYQAEASNQPLTLAAPEKEFADYVEWQQDLLASAEGEKLKSYWKEQLKGAATELDMRTDRARPPMQTYNGALLEFRLDNALLTALHDLAKAEGTTLYMLLLAAYQVLLYRYTGQDDILVGSPTSGRTRADFASIVGYFVNPVVMRARFSAPLSFRDFLKQVRQTVLDALAHQDYPFILMVEDTIKQRDFSRSPLFQVMFNLLKIQRAGDTFELLLSGQPGVQADFGGLLLEPYLIPQEEGQFDIALEMLEVGGVIRGTLKYNTDLFDAGTMERFHQNYITLVESILAYPEQDIAQLPILSEAERQQVLAGWNATAADYPQDATLQQLFEAQVERTPDAVALISGDGRLSYRDLNAKANQLAHHLRSLGVQAETLVGVSMERSPELVMALLAILKAGGVYVPLDPHYPQERLSFIIEDTGLEVILTQAVVAANLPENRTKVISVDTAWPADQPTANLSIPAQIDDLAYVIYTSGSTGRPKGVMALHRGAVNRLTWMWRTFPFGVGEVNSQKTSLNFVDAVWENFGALLQGVPTVIISDDVVKDAPALVKTLAENHVTRLTLVPSLLRALLDSGHIQDLHSLTHWITSGEVLPVELVQRFREALPDCRLINLYGSSEVAADVTCFDTRDYDNQASVPVGKPIANTQIYLLDAQMQPVPLGVAGEIHVGGAGLARGYLNRPELTDQKFVANPFSTDANARLYKTGDQGRYLPDGAIAYGGRVDYQVKLRGFRIELGEIEAVLTQVPGVRQALVILREDTPGDPRLVAYAVGEDVPAPGVLRTHLKTILPDYMIPSAFIVLEALPLTPNGKVDRLALPVPEAVRRGSDATIVSPRTPVEQSIAAVWSEVLGVERIGVHDDFFDLGGHSLKATQVAGRLQDIFGVAVPVRLLLDHPTIAGLAAVVEGQSRAADGGRLEDAIVPVARDGRLPLSFAQERLWIIEKMMPTGSAYNIPGAIQLKGRLDVGVLEASLTEIVRRHEVLRTTFHSSGGKVEQRIHESRPFKVTFFDAQSIPAAERDSQIATWIQEETHSTFDLENGPLVRARLIQVDDDDHIIVLNMYHIVSDGWSMGVVVDEFTTLYQALAAGEPSPLPELPIQYADFAAWQRRTLTDEALAGDVAYWKNHLQGALPVLVLPTNHPRPSVQTYTGEMHTFYLTPAVTDGLKVLSRQEKSTLFMTLMAAFGVLLWRYSGQEDMVIGSPIANRRRTEVEKLIGFFVNTLALRLDLSGDPGFVDLMARVREVSLGAYAHQDMPFEKLVEVLNPDRGTNYPPVFQVMFVLQNAPLGTIELPGLTVAPLDVNPGASKFDLTLYLREAAGGMEGQFEYNTDLFDESTILRMESHFARLLENVVASPSRPISELSLLTEAERQHILVEWNDTTVSYPLDVSVYQLFEAQVERTPEAVAVVCKDHSLTYRELNERANQLAHYLRGLEVGADTLVGVCMERSLEMVISVYAILKAGGAYVPMDPEYPPARLAYMLQDSDVPVLLTQAHLIPQLPEHQAKVISLDTEWATIAVESNSNLSVDIQPDNLAYMIYTSGSTGNPKGVLIEHRGLTNYIWWANQTYQNGESLTFPLFSSLSFDLTVTSIYVPLISGGKIIVYPGDPEAPGMAILKVIEDNQVDIVKLTPSHLAFIQNMGFGQSRLRKFIVGGEEFKTELARAVHDTFGGKVEIYNEYGPTETVVGCMIYRFDPVADTGQAVSIGVPIANQRIYVLDNHLNPTPMNVIGEMYVSGVGVARGYLNRPELTAERFISNPFVDGERLYKTGDLARWKSDGTLEFLGRADHQVKLRGFRIELGEIEAAISGYPGVKECVVILREDTPGDKRLAAYLTASTAPDSTELRQHLREQLPEYMVPAAFVVLDTIPMTPNAKVDRAALPVPGITRQEQTDAPAQSPTEAMIAAVWAEVLGFANIGVYDNFFDLGGHSLQSIEVIAQLTEQTGVKIDPAMMRFQTLGQLAASYDERLAQTPVSEPESEDESGLTRKLFKAFRRGK